MIGIILLVLAAVVMALVIVVAMQPTDFRVSRGISVGAAAGTVFALVNDLPQWQRWSPWVRLDPQAKLTYSGPQSGTGASYEWVGNKQMGQGRLTITDSRPVESIHFRLEFIKPFQAVNTTEFVFVPEGGGTGVTWRMLGKKNFMFKAVGLFMNPGKMVGGDFEKGLANLKAIAEAAPQG